jgi:hypothetical protein
MIIESPIVLKKESLHSRGAMLAIGAEKADSIGALKGILSRPTIRDIRY